MGYNGNISWWLIIALFCLGGYFLYIGEVRRNRVLQDGACAITTEIRKKRARYGMSYYFTYNTNDGEKRQGTDFIPFWKDMHAIDTSSRYIIAYAPQYPRSSILVRNMKVGDSIPIDSIYRIKLTPELYEKWEL